MLDIKNYTHAASLMQAHHLRNYIKDLQKKKYIVQYAEARPDYVPLSYPFHYKVLAPKWVYTSATNKIKMEHSSLKARPYGYGRNYHLTVIVPTGEKLRMGKCIKRERWLFLFDKLTIVM